MQGMQPKPIIRNNVTPQALVRAASLIRDVDNIVVLTGAGISTDSGIPDFRGPQGLWTTNPASANTSNINTYLTDKSVRIASWRRGGLFAMGAKPNEGHECITRLYNAGKLQLLVTQNIDGLHQAAGIPQDKIVEAHGHLREYECCNCGTDGPMWELQNRLDAGEEDPECTLCGGILKAKVVMFNELLDLDDIRRFTEATETCDLLLVVGTSLNVPPVNGMVKSAHYHGAYVIIVNAQSTPKDHYATLSLRGQIGDILPAII